MALSGRGKSQLLQKEIVVSVAIRLLSQISYIYSYGSPGKIYLNFQKKVLTVFFPLESFLEMKQSWRKWDWSFCEV